MSVCSSRSGSAQHTAATTPRSSPSSSQSSWGKNAKPFDLGYSHDSASYSFPSSATPDAAFTPSGSNDQWWEHVLPPGQLAERLRRAQVSPEVRSATVPRRSQAPLAIATPTERKVWKRFSELDQDGGVQSQRGSATSSSRRSSASTSGETSSDETASHSSDQHSPDGKQRGLRFYDEPDSNGSYWSSFDRNQQTRSFSRSSASRRTRVMSEDGLGLGIQTSSPHGPPPGRLSSHHAHLRHFGYSGFVSPSLSDTPEVSSNDESDDRSSSTTTTTTTRHTRTVSMTATYRSNKSFTPPTILRSHFDHAEDGIESIYNPSFAGGRTARASTSDRPRHVSFNGDFRGAAQAAAAKRHSFSSADSAFGSERQFYRDVHGSFDGYASRSSSTRRSRHGVRSGHDRRTSSFSAPSSRRASVHFDKSPYGHGASTPTGHGGHRRSSSISDIPLFDGISVAQTQLATAGHLAAAFTRQLSAPLRPVFHLTLFLSISSITLISLACFLAAGYLLTAWDDVTQKTQKVTSAAETALRNIESTISWGVNLLASDAVGDEPKSQLAATAGAASAEHADCEGYDMASASVGRKSGKSHVAWPLGLARAGASAIALRVMPKPIFEALGFGHRTSTAVARVDRSRTQRQQRHSSLPRLPPRPPLSLLLPSILFTLLIALGAGLASFFASRQAASDARGVYAGPDYGAPMMEEDEDVLMDSASTAFFSSPSATVGRSAVRNRGRYGSSTLADDAHRFTEL